MGAFLYFGVSGVVVLVADALDEAGIEVPLPQTDLRIRSAFGLEGGGKGGYGYQTRIPLTELPPGSYVLNVEARSRLGTDNKATRQVQFQVVPPQMSRGWVIQTGLARGQLANTPIYLRVKFRSAAYSLKPEQLQKLLAEAKPGDLLLEITTDKGDHIRVTIE